MLRLRWPAELKVIQQGDLLDVSVVLENLGSGAIEFGDGFLELFARLIDERGHDVATEGLLSFRKLPRIEYRLEPGDALDVEVRVRLSLEDQRSLPVGHYTVVVPEDETAKGCMNSVLASAAVAPPGPLTIVVR